MLISSSCHRVGVNTTNDDRYLGKMVAFAQSDETWMTPDMYGHVGSSYLSGTI